MNPISSAVKAVALASAVLSLAVKSEPYRQLFFDDQRLYVRENLERVYGEPKLEEIYQDDMLAVEYGWVWALDGPDGNVHMVYLGEHKDSHQLITAAAVSEDGIHFAPRNTAAEAGLKNPRLPYQLLDNPPNGEIGTVLADPTAAPEERYKLFFCDFCTLGEWRVSDYVMASPDLIHWKRLDNSCWNTVGTEPMVGAFYNSVTNRITVLSRPDWGQRRVAHAETADWHEFSPAELCLQVDSIDPALAEIYGMPAFAYEGYFIGIVHLYFNVPQVRTMKFSGGQMRCELAYSLNGRHWQRCLRKPFLDGEHSELCARLGQKAGMMFLTSMRRDKDGSILLYGSATVNEHGDAEAGWHPDRSSIYIMRLREDGFVGLKVQDGTMGRVASRPVYCQGPSLSVNLESSHATCAVFEHDGLATVRPIPGFGHEDCEPFSGDSTSWTPHWKGHGDLSELIGKQLVIEIQLDDGTIYSFTVDGIPCMEIEAERVRAFQRAERRKGF